MVGRALLVRDDTAFEKDGLETRPTESPYLLC